MLFHLGLSSYFQEVVCPDSRSPNCKEKTEGLRYLLRKYALRADQCIYVGDSVADLYTAESSGVLFIGVEYGYGLLHDLPNQPIWCHLSQNCLQVYQLGLPNYPLQHSGEMK